MWDRAKKKVSIRAIIKNIKGNQKQKLGIAKRDVQSDAFYFVLVLSIVSDLIDIISSTAMNYATNWWFYQITMTIYVLSIWPFTCYS